MSERQPEHEVQHRPQVLEGDDELPRQPTLERDPYVPEPYERRGERHAWRWMRFSIFPVLAVVAIVVYAAVR